MNGIVLFVVVNLALFLTVTGARPNSCDEDAQDTVFNNTLFLLVVLPHVNSSTIASLHHSWLDGASVVPALQLAVEQINNNSHNSSSSNATISIPGYKLELVFANDGCESQRDTLVNLTKELYPENGRRVVGIVGPACSESAAVVSSFTEQMEVSLALLHGAILADRVQHPYSLGVLGSRASLVRALIELMEREKWKRIGILYQESSLYYSTIFNKFCSLLPSDVKLAFLSTVSHNFYSISTLRDSKVRVIFVMASLEHVRRITCLAFRNQLIYPGYQWIMVGSTLSDLYARPSTYQFTYNRLQYICSLGDILSKALKASLFLHHALSTVDKTRDSETGISYDEFDTQYNDRVKSHNEQLPEEKKQMSIPRSFWSSIFYDAVWVWAKVLGEIVRARQFDFTCYDYGNDTLTELIVDRFFNLTFDGVSGNVTFRGKGEDGYTERIVHLAQVINSNETVVLVLKNSKLSSTSEEMIPLLPDTFPVHYIMTDSAIVGVFGAIVLLEAIALAALHILTIVYRKHKSVKASSFKLNQLAYLGCYIYIIGLLLSVFNDVDLNAVGPTCDVAWGWCYPIALTIMIGTAVARTWRLYRIFIHYLEPGHLISNGVLITFILILVAINVVFGTMWTVIDPLRLRLQEVPRPSDHPITDLDYTLHCVSEHHAIWTTISFFFTGLIFFSLVMLSCMTRRINRRHYSTSSLQLFTYFFAIVFLIGVPVYYIALFSNPDPNARFLFRNISMDAILCLYAVCVFVPPLIPVFKEQKKKKKAKLSELVLTPSMKRLIKRQSTNTTVVSPL